MPVATLGALARTADALGIDSPWKDAPDEPESVRLAR
jgi:hypothetical protein